jgi:type I restriction enzyme S subunit
MELMDKVKTHRDQSERNEGKTRYKQTEVGVIPEDWEIKSIKEFAVVRGGKRLPFGEYLTDKITPYPYLRVKDMQQGGVDLSDIKYVPENAFDIIKNYRIFINDIFISVAGTLGIVGKIPPELDGANLTENADRVTNISCDRDFLLYNLMSNRIQNIIESEKTVGAQPKLALGKIENFTISLPPTLSEQIAIATALSDVDSLIQKLDELIAKKRDLKQATMQQLLTGKMRLHGFSSAGDYKQTEVGVIPDDWGIRSLGALATMVSSGRSSAGKMTGNYPVHGSTGIIGYTSNPEYKGDVILVARVGANAGKMNFVSGEYGVTDNTIILNFPSNVCLAFIWRQLESKRLNNLVFGSGQPLITGTQLKALRLAIPPLPEQTAIATVLSDMDAEITALEARQEKTRLLKQGMMQELLTGRIRLV